MANVGPATVVVTGAAGMLGHEVVATAPAWAAVVPLTRADCDLSEISQLHRFFRIAKPHIIVHCAAFTDVDGATRDPEAAWQGNALVTQRVAAIAEELNARLLYISTDYVFDGSAQMPYTESSPVHPLNAYGASKLAGEHAAALVPGGLIVRTQWLFGSRGRNFVQAILTAADSRKSLRIVQDEYGCPTYTADLAHGIWRLLENSATGIVHLTNTGACSRVELAGAALEMAGIADVELIGIRAEEWASPTIRPKKAVLGSERLIELGLRPLRSWREALAEYVSLFMGTDG